jgi:putative transcriptional regulator
VKCGSHRGHVRNGVLPCGTLARETAAVAVFRSKLWYARVRAGLTQAALAESIGASRETVSLLERRRTIPSVTLAIAVARRLDVGVEELFDASELR